MNNSNVTSTASYASSYAYGAPTTITAKTSLTSKKTNIDMDSLTKDQLRIQDQESFDEPHDICVTLDSTTNGGFQKKIDIPGVFSYQDNGNVCKFYGESDEFIARIRSHSIVQMTASIQES